MGTGKGQWVALYARYHSAYAEAYDTADEAFGCLYYGAENGDLSARGVVGPLPAEDIARMRKQYDAEQDRMARESLDTQRQAPRPTWAVYVQHDGTDYELDRYFDEADARAAAEQVTVAPAVVRKLKV